MDTVAPGPPGITSTGFTNGQWATSAPSSNTFTFSQAAGTTDTAAYLYTEDGGAQQTLTATNGTANLSWLPASGGHTLLVWARDAAGNVST